MITFTYGALSYTFRAPEFSDVEETTYVQARGRTQDGELVVGDKGITTTRRILSWKVLSPTVKTQLQTFFNSSNVNGSMQTFTYTDHGGTPHTVRLVDGSLEWTNYYIDLFSVSMILEDVTAAAGS